ncbi:MAG TPA: DUF748 domain-containing protein [Chitinophagaceae bacterium]|nr:DUF748 domain-containing protein [Chitinophagaceae bacterium]
MKLRRIIYILLIVIAGLLFLAFIFISPIAKYVIEKNSEQWTGRKITMEHLWVNLFTGTVHASGLKVYEHKSNTVFFNCGDLRVSVSLRKLLSSEYDVREIKLIKPGISIIQNGTHFNYDDLVKRFGSTPGAHKEKKSAPAKYWIHNVLIDSATINYSTSNPKASVSLINFNLSCPELAYNKPALLVTADFGLKSGGAINAALHLNSGTLAYSLKLGVSKLNIAFLYPYVHDYMKINSLDGIISASINFTGNFNTPEAIALSGYAETQQFSLVDNTGEKLTAAEDIKVGIDTLNTQQNLYRFDTISLTQPYLALAMYNDGYNFERIMTEPPSAVSSDSSSAAYTNVFQMMAGYLKDIVQQYIISNYVVNRFAVNNGEFIFTDYTLEDKFRYDLDEVHITSGDLNSKKERVNLAFDSRLNNSGLLKGAMSVNPDGFRDMDLNFTVTNFLMPDMNPYFVHYVATPFNDGAVVYECNTTVKNNQLNSKNKVTIRKIVAGKKVKSKTAYKLPVRLAVSLLKDVKGNINLDIPVEGNLSDPKYRLGKVIWGIVKNIIVKAATAPARLLSRAFGGKQEDYDQIRFSYLQKTLSAEQLRIASNLAKAMTDKPDLSLTLVQVNNKQDEMEKMALLHAKEQYLGIGIGDSLSESALASIDSLGNTDSLFDAWVDTRLHIHASLNSIQNRCVQLIGKDKLGAATDQLMQERNVALATFFAQKNIAPARITISNATDDKLAAAASSPVYLITFNAGDALNATPEAPAQK